MSIATKVETIALGPEQNGIRMTPAEFDAVDQWDDDYRYELNHGVLIVNPPPLEQERSPNEILGYLLLKYQEEHPQGSHLDATLPEHTIRTPGSRRRADRVIWAGLDRQPDPAADLPAIAVEFVSEGRRNWRRDYVEKRDEYLAAGLLEYWVVDRFQRIMRVYRKTAAGWKETTVKETEAYRTDLLPGFELPLARLLEAADRWRKK